MVGWERKRRKYINQLNHARAEYIKAKRQCERLPRGSPAFRGARDRLILWSRRISELGEMLDVMASDEETSWGSYHSSDYSD